jgi:DNA-binding Lrp family transcriptional regulator
MKIGEIYNPWELFYGAQIPNVILKNKNLTSTAKLVFGRLAQFAGQNGKCFPSQETLAEEIGSSESSIQSAIKNLVDEGYIKKIEPSGNERLKHYSCSYEFMWHQTFDKKFLTKKGKEILNKEVDMETTAPGIVNPLSNNNKIINFNGSSLRKKIDAQGAPSEDGIHKEIINESNIDAQGAPDDNVPSCKDKIRPAASEDKTETFVEKVFRYNKNHCIERNLAVPVNGAYDLSGLETLIDYWKEKHIEDLSNPSKVTWILLERMLDVYTANGGYHE